MSISIPFQGRVQSYTTLWKRPTIDRGRDDGDFGLNDWVRSDSSPPGVEWDMIHWY